MGAVAKSLPPLDLAAVLEEPLDWRFRAFPEAAPGVTVGDVGRQGWNALRDFDLPVLTLSRSALDHNVELLARFCADRGLSLAPHAKTPMAPQIVERQRAAGAWGISAATVDQVRVLHACGVRRVVLANEVVDRAGLAWLGRLLRDDEDFELYVFADSVAGVTALGDAIRAATGSARARVLIEVGHAGGRTGCRTVEEARAVAASIAASDRLRLAGVAGYEGSVGSDGEPSTIEAVDRFLADVRTVGERLAADGSFAETPEAVVSAGGSGYFDRVAATLGGEWPGRTPVRVVLRCGAYVAHDSGHYERLSPLDGRSQGGARLRPALEIWGAVTARPEAARAIVGFGKRDAPHDLELPIPFAIVDADGQRDGAALRVSAFNDHHAFVDVPPGVHLAVGDTVGARIVHPCTAFDKWRLVPLVADDYSVVGAIRTFF